MPKPRIVIAARGYNPTKGGHIVLHKLCDSLLRVGFDAYMMPHGKHWAVNPKYLSQVADRVYRDDVVIYHNSIVGNPFNATKYMRWMLYRPTVAKDGFLLYFSEQFGNGPILRVIEPHLELFYNRHEPRTSEVEAWTWRKAEREGFKPKDKPTSGFEVERGLSAETLADIFNQYERFTAYDGATFLSVQAALCGCDSVVPKLVGGVFPYPGIATSIADIPRAHEEHELLRETIEREYLEQDAKAGEVIEWALKKMSGIV